MMEPTRLLSDIQLVAFDLETTGLSPHDCQIVEFGAIRFQLDGTVLECFEQLVDPECYIPRSATRIHGITDAMVCGMPTVAETLPRYLDFLGQDNSVSMAHNAAFDVGFIRAAIGNDSSQIIASPVIDTLRLARRAIPGMYNYRLENLAIALQLADSEDHRALSDARLVMGLFCKIVELRQDLTTAEQLFALAPPLKQAAMASSTRRFNYDHGHLTLAIQQQRTVVMVYEGGTKGLTNRRVTPRGLVTSYGTRCLVAFCHTDKIEKTFRLDRIRELRIEDQELE